MDYERIPWILDAGTVRITFDSDVRAAIGSYDIFDPGLPAVSVLEPGKLILEVKFTEMLPQLLRDVLPPSAAEFTAVSKYVLCYEKTRYMNEMCIRDRYGLKVKILRVPYLYSGIYKKDFFYRIFQASKESQKLFFQEAPEQKALSLIHIYWINGDAIQEAARYYMTIYGMSQVEYHYGILENMKTIYYMF